jgi:hypothetical protein
MLGHDVGGLRLPLVEATEEEAGAVRAMLQSHGLLAGGGPVVGDDPVASALA